MAFIVDLEGPGRLWAGDGDGGGKKMSPGFEERLIRAGDLGLNPCDLGPAL